MPFFNQVNKIIPEILHNKYRNKRPILMTETDQLLRDLKRQTHM